MELYFIAILPPEDIRKKIKSFKLEMADSFGVKHSLKLPAHITLISLFKLNDVQEKDLVSGLKKFVENQLPFYLKLSNFHSFPPRVIFVDVANKEPVIKLRENLQRHLAFSFQSVDQGDRFHPHLTIATRDLQGEIFIKAWKEFENRKYETTFEVNSLSLMKHNGKSWDIFKELKFQNDEY